MIKSLVDYYHWNVSEIKKMYADDVDFQGIVYWYDELVRINKQMKQSK